MSGQDPTTAAIDRAVSDASLRALAVFPGARAYAEAVHAEARLQLEPALVARNSAGLRRSDLAMNARRLEDLIAEAERDLDRARQAAEPARDLLARIRARVLGEPSGAA
jgi:hypothetical protein